MPTYYLGLDVHKVRTQYCLMDRSGEILREGNVSTEETADLVPDPGSAVVLEATGRASARSKQRSPEPACGSRPDSW